MKKTASAVVPTVPRLLSNWVTAHSLGMMLGEEEHADHHQGSTPGRNPLVGGYSPCSMCIWELVILDTSGRKTKRHCSR